MSYIRGGRKSHGKGSQIEGADVKGKKVVVIEDLVSTGGSSLGAVSACRDAGAEVVGMVAIFTYEYQASKKRFLEEKCNVVFLTDFSTLVKVAADNGYIKKDELELVLEWSRDPQGWGPKHGFALGEKKN
jgi:orotate phosphoribosyltransferase